MRPADSRATYPIGHANKAIEAVIYYLDDWLDALTDGSYFYRFPDPAYVRPDGKPMWTEGELETIITAIDAQVHAEARGTPGNQAGCNKPPDYIRLPLLQRLALVQGLEQIIERWRIEPNPCAVYPVLSPDGRVP